MTEDLETVARQLLGLPPAPAVVDWERLAAQLREALALDGDMAALEERFDVDGDTVRSEATVLAGEGADLDAVLAWIFDKADGLALLREAAFEAEKMARQKVVKAAAAPAVLRSARRLASVLRRALAESTMPEE